MGRETVVIIIPTYNEALVIEETIHQVIQATASIDDKAIHLLIFDSASTDETQAIVKRLQLTHPTLHLQTEPVKTGLGSAYLQAMRYALNQLSADIVIEFDADLSHQPMYLPQMLAAIKQQDVVVGSRYVTGGSIPSEWGFHRKLLSVVGNYIARAILTSKYKDFTSGFRATRRHVLLQALPEQFLTNHYAYKLQLLWRLHQCNARITELPIAFVDRTKGVSKLPANSIIDSLRILVTLRFQTISPYVLMCLVGCGGMVVQFSLYNALRGALSPFYASQVAVLGAIMNNFLLNNRLTFKNRQFSNRFKKIRSFSVFVFYSILMIYLQSYWLWLGMKYLGTGSLKENVIMATGIVLGSFLNYLTYSNLVWNNKKSVIINEANEKWL